jgi:hypothetical protein
MIEMDGNGDENSCPALISRHSLTLSNSNDFGHINNGMGILPVKLPMFPPSTGKTAAVFYVTKEKTKVIRMRHLNFNDILQTKPYAFLYVVSCLIEKCDCLILIPPLNGIGQNARKIANSKWKLKNV